MCLICIVTIVMVIILVIMNNKWSWAVNCPECLRVDSVSISISVDQVGVFNNRIEYGVFRVYNCSCGISWRGERVK